MFSAPVRSIWFVLFAITLVSELVPLSLAFEAQFPPLVFRCYEAAKLLAFFVLGFLTPIAWWDYKSLGRGALFAIVTTGIVEIGQAFIPGHRASTLELAVKLVLIFTGFVCGLDARKDQQFTVGTLCIRFSSRYWHAFHEQSGPDSAHRECTPQLPTPAVYRYWHWHAFVDHRAKPAPCQTQ
jgi:hypothetical protein